MGAARKRRERVFAYEGLGFPVHLHNVPMVRIHDVWTPDVDLNRLSSMVLEALAHKPARLTGNEIRFIRLSWRMTLQQFAERFAVSHPAVMKWESAGNESTSMAWATEKDIRLEVIQRGNVVPAVFVRLYLDLTSSRPEHPQSPTAVELGGPLIERKPRGESRSRSR